jgi:hypothetical protein
MFNNNASPRLRQENYHGPPPEYWAAGQRALERHQLEGLSPLAIFQPHLKQLGFVYTPEGDSFRTHCPLACGDSSPLAFGPGRAGGLILVCHRCLGSKKTFAATMNALGPGDLRRVPRGASRLK